MLYTILNLKIKHFPYSFLHRAVNKTINRPMPSLLPRGPCSACSPMLWYSLTGELSHSCPVLSFACSLAHGSTLMTLQSAPTQGGWGGGESFDELYFQMLRWSCLDPVHLSQIDTVCNLQVCSAQIRYITHVSLNYSRRLSFVSWVTNSIRNPTPTTGRHMCL